MRRINPLSWPMVELVMPFIVPRYTREMSSCFEAIKPQRVWVYSSHQLMTPRGSLRFGFGSESGEFHLTKECCLDCMEPLEFVEAVFQYAWAIDQMIAVGSRRWCPVCTRAQNLVPDPSDKDRLGWDGSYSMWGRRDIRRHCFIPSTIGNAKQVHPEPVD